MQIYQNKNGYCYNSDTLFLYHFAHVFLKPNQKVLDIGAGSGILGLLCARDVKISLTMIEKSQKMHALALQNARINQIKAHVLCDDFLVFDFHHLRFDVILSNPPFYANGVLKSQKEDLSLARYACHLPFDKMACKIASLLGPRGEFIFCYDAKQIAWVMHMLCSCRLNPIVLQFVHPSKDKPATLVLCRAKKDSKNATQILPPLFTHHAQSFSQEVQAIYQKAKTWSIKV